MHVDLSTALQDKLDQYCRNRKEELGKLITRNRAIVEILEKGLSEVQPPTPVLDRLAAIEARLDALEVEKRGS
mgnify:CR=1 FL=1